MTLRYDVTGILNYNQNYDSGKEWHPVTQAIVWRMVHTRIGPELTEKNAAEFYARCHLLDKLDGGMYITPKGTQSLTPEQIRTHIGLRVNVKAESRSKFLNRWIQTDLNRWFNQYGQYVDYVEGRNSV